MAVLRWLLVFPAAVAGWYSGLITGMAIYWLNQWLCPVRYLVSGVCFAPWSGFVGELAFVAGSATAAALFVWLPAVAAPSHRRGVAWTGFLAGLGVTVKILCDLVAEAGFQETRIYWLPAGAAVFAGGCTLSLLVRRHGDADSA